MSSLKQRNSVPMATAGQSLPTVLFGKPVNVFEVNQNFDVMIFPPKQWKLRAFSSQNVISKPPIYTIHPRWVCRKGVRVTAMCSEASRPFLTKQTDVTYVLNIPPQRHRVLQRRTFKAAEGVLKDFWLTFKVQQGLFCQDWAAVNLCSSESAALHTNANAARAKTPSLVTGAI